MALLAVGSFGQPKRKSDRWCLSVALRGCVFLLGWKPVVGSPLQGQHGCQPLMNRFVWVLRTIPRNEEAVEFTLRRGALALGQPGCRCPGSGTPHPTSTFWRTALTEIMIFFRLQRGSREWLRSWAQAVGLLALAFASGCRPSSLSPLVIFLDGAGHFTAGRSVRQGLEGGGFIGSFETFSWSSFLGPGADHLVVARSQGKARQLADRICRARREFPQGKIYVMGLSAGTALVLSALENLPGDVSVEGVVLFSPSVSAERKLTPALRHVAGRLYATCSQHDMILANLAVNADGGSGPPAGCRGFVLPLHLTNEDQLQYAKVVNIQWQPSYLGHGWYGGHVDVTSSRFVRQVIAPRILSDEPYPLDRPLLSRPGQPFAMCPQPFQDGVGN